MASKDQVLQVVTPFGPTAPDLFRGLKWPPVGFFFSAKVKHAFWSNICDITRPGPPSGGLVREIPYYSIWPAALGAWWGCFWCFRLPSKAIIQVQRWICCKTSGMALEKWFLGHLALGIFVVPWSPWTPPKPMETWRFQTPEECGLYNA